MMVNEFVCSLSVSHDSTLRRHLNIIDFIKSRLNSAEGDGEGR